MDGFNLFLAFSGFCWMKKGTDGGETAWSQICCCTEDGMKQKKFQHAPNIVVSPWHSIRSYFWITWVNVWLIGHFVVWVMLVWLQNVMCKVSGCKWWTWLATQASQSQIKDWHLCNQKTLTNVFCAQHSEVAGFTNLKRCRAIPPHTFSLSMQNQCGIELLMPMCKRTSELAC